jgi:hypothetical protein
MEIEFACMAMNQFFVCFKKYNNFDTDDEKKLEQIKNKLPKQVNSWRKYCRELKIRI